MAKSYIGTSGYSYNHWIDQFYPPDLSKTKWLQFYSQHFSTVELNVTFYRLPQASTFEKWYCETPADFHFAVKGSRLITQYKKLKHVEEPLGLFFDRTLLLNEKLAVILWQFPPNYSLDIASLNNFCRLLKLFPQVRHAFEFRHDSWFNLEVYDLLNQYNFAIVIADYPFDLRNSHAKWPGSDKQIIQIPDTADFIYLRRHGAAALYSSSYSDDELAHYASSIKSWLSNDQDVYVYFNNDAAAHAIFDAQKLNELVK